MPPPPPPPHKLPLFRVFGPFTKFNI
eukprot:SAG22_NODE_12667_length_428_cov_3.356287_1_plen_25_part_10